MKNIPARISTVCVLAALPLLVFAHGGVEHEKSAKTGAESSEHAAALGEPGKAAKATRTVEVKMSDAMRFEPSSIPVKKGETIRFVIRNEGKIKHEMVLGTTSELKEHAAMMQKMPNMNMRIRTPLCSKPARRVTWYGNSPRQGPSTSPACSLAILKRV